MDAWWLGIWSGKASEIGKDSLRLAVVNERLVFSPVAVFLKAAGAVAGVADVVEAVAVFCFDEGQFWMRNVFQVSVDKELQFFYSVISVTIFHNPVAGAGKKVL